VSAAEAGYRLFDTAYAYGNEEGVGRGLRRAVCRARSCPHDQAQRPSGTASRRCRTGGPPPRKRLDVDYIDLFMIHWPLPRQDGYVDAVRGLAKLLGTAACARSAPPTSSPRTSTA